MNTTVDYFCTKLMVGPLIWAVFSLPCACVGVPASVWLLWVLIQRQHSGSSNNVYMLNVTIMDLIYNVFKPAGVLNFFVSRDMRFSVVIYFLEGLNFTGRPLLMACSCVDCYMAVVHPIGYMRISQSRYRAVVCVVIWVSTLVFSLLYTLIDNSHKKEAHLIPCVLAISTMTLCNVTIFCVLRKPDPSGRSDIHPQKQRALQSIINSFIMTLVSYLPMLIFVMFMDRIPLSWQEEYCHIYIPALVFSMLGSTILPLLYLRNLGCLNDLRHCDCI